MINLLPLEDKKRFQKQVRSQKMGLVALFVLMGFLGLVCFFFVFSSYVASQVAPGLEKIEMVQNFFRSEQFSSFRQGLEQTNKQTAQIKKFLDEQPSVIYILDRLTLTLPPGIYFKTLFFSKKGSQQGLVSISGQADTREHLYLFKQNLEAEPSFKDVQFQLSSWIQPKQADFSLTFLANTK